MPSSGNLSGDMCQCCLSGEEQLQIEKSKRIDRELAAYKRKFQATQKIVLLGAGESGKSTFLKQMQIIHGEGFSQEEKIQYRTQIYENILRGIVGLINGKIELDLPWRGQANDSRTPIDVTIQMKNILNEFRIIYRHLMDDREQESIRLKKRLDILPEYFVRNNLVEIIITIWSDMSIQEAFERRREIPRYFVENVPYFIQNMERISKKVF